MACPCLAQVWGLQSAIHYNHSFIHQLIVVSNIEVTAALREINRSEHATHLAPPADETGDMSCPRTWQQSDRVGQRRLASNRLQQDKPLSLEPLIPQNTCEDSLHRTVLKCIKNKINVLVYHTKCQQIHWSLKLQRKKVWRSLTGVKTLVFFLSEKILLILLSHLMKTNIFLTCLPLHDKSTNIILL